MLPETADAHPYEPENSSVEAKKCENRIRQRRLSLKRTEMRLDVFAAYPIRSRGVVCLYYGKYVQDITSYATYTVEPIERDDYGRREYVSAEDCGSTVRIIAHAF